MSTPLLRDIARMVPIEHAAFSEVTAAVFLLGPVAIAGFAVVLFHHGVMASEPAYRATLVGISLLSRLILVLLLCRSHWDEQRYILKIMSKLLAMYFWLYMIVVVFALIFRDLNMNGAALLWLLVGDICSVSILSFAILGVRGLANLPLGLKVLRLFFTRGSNAVDAISASSQPELCATFRLGVPTTSRPILLFSLFVSCVFKPLILPSGPKHPLVQSSPRRCFETYTRAIRRRGDNTAPCRLSKGEFRVDQWICSVLWDHCKIVISDMAAGGMSSQISGGFNIQQ